MAISRWHALLLLLPALMGMRDPFQPPEDRCRLAELARWRYGGAAGGGSQLTGFIQDGAERWHRIKEGQVLENNRTVHRIAAEHLEITLDAQCEPSRWRWLKQGAKQYAQERVSGRDAGDSGIDMGIDGERGASDASGG